MLQLWRERGRGISIEGVSHEIMITSNEGKCREHSAVLPPLKQTLNHELATLGQVCILKFLLNFFNIIKKAILRDLNY